MRMAIKRLMAKGLPDYLVNQFTTEVRLATRRMFTARRHDEISGSVFESRPREKQTLSSGEPLSSTMRDKMSRQCHRWLPSSVVEILKKLRTTSSARS